MKNLKTFEEYSPAEIGTDDYVDDWDQAYDLDDEEFEPDKREIIEIEPVDNSEHDEELPF